MIDWKQVSDFDNIYLAKFTLLIEAIWNDRVIYSVFARNFDFESWEQKWVGNKKFVTINKYSSSARKDFNYLNKISVSRKDMKNEKNMLPQKSA